MSDTPLDQPTLLRLPRVIERTGLSRSTIYALMDRGEFPKTIPLGTRAVAWVESEITAFIKSRIATTRKAPKPAGSRVAA